MKNQNLTRKEKQNLQNRHEILETALNLFAKDGFHRVTMQQIAQHSEFSVGTLYNFFTNKEELYSAIVKEKADEFQHRVEQAIDKDGPEIEKLKAFIEEKIALFQGNKNFIRLYFSETMGMGFNVKHGLEENIRNHYEEMLDKMANVFECGIEKGEFKKFDPNHLAVAFEGMTNALIHESLESPQKFNIDAQLLMTIFFQSVSKSSNL